jgi:hypothetical protein
MCPFFFAERKGISIMEAAMTILGYQRKFAKLRPKDCPPQPTLSPSPAPSPSPEPSVWPHPKDLVEAMLELGQTAPMPSGDGQPRGRKRKELDSSSDDESVDREVTLVGERTRGKKGARPMAKFVQNYPLRIPEVQNLQR